MSNTKLQLISTYNLQFLARLIKGVPSEVKIDAYQKAFGQEMQQILTGAEADYTLIWVAPESVCPTFADVVNLREVDEAALMAELDAFCDAVLTFSQGQDVTMVASFEMLPGYKGYGLLDLRNGLGVQQFLYRLNLKMIERFSDEESIYMLDTGSWYRGFDGFPGSTKLWYAAKTPFSIEFQQHCATAIHATMRSLRGHFRRIIILDLDDTLWGGVIGEVGWKGIELGGHSIRGEAFKAFQQALAALQNRGIQLAVCSKNDEGVALEAFEHHHEMVLSVKDLAGWRINWADKAGNIEDLVDEIGLGLDSVVFLDDSPAERARVRETLDEVFVPEFPNDPVLFRDFLWSLDCFDTQAITTEDRTRSAMYSQDRKRRESFSRTGDLREWIRSLETRVRVDLLDDSNVVRVVQLINKTNQFNLRTRRMTQRELEEWLQTSANHMWAFSSEDRLGSAGLIGVAGLHVENGLASVTDFLMSCRVMGREIENAMLAVVVEAAASFGASCVRLDYIESERNRPTMDFLVSSGLKQTGEIEFEWSDSGAFPAPDTLTLVYGQTRESHPASSS